MSQPKQPEKYIQADDWSNFAEKYEKGIGGTTRYIAKHLLKLSPPFSKQSVVLDNACGTGIVTEEVQETLKSQPNMVVNVYAADAAPHMVRILDAKVEKVKRDGDWPNIGEISTHTVPAEDLDESRVPSDIITHAYMNFGIFFCTEPLKAARNVYRTMAPGATAFFTTWADLGYEDFMRKTESTCNPGKENFMLPFAHEWKNPEYVADLLCNAGFAKDNIKVVQNPSYFRASSDEHMADLQSELFGMLIRGPSGFGGPEKLDTWKKTLIQNMKVDEHYFEDDSGVAIKMLANIATCTK